MPDDGLVITLDVDWAPDFVIDAAAATLSEHGARATWYVTHASPAIDRLRERPDLFELGIHPNFLPGTTHGEDPVAHLLDIVPGARCARTHSLLQSTPLLERLMAGGIAVDCSLLLPRHPGLRPVTHVSQGGSLTRVPFIWEDDLEMERDDPIWSVDRLLALGEGLKVLAFHPVHVWLNSASFDAYASLRGRLGDVAEDEAAALRQDGPGAGTLFAEVVAHLAAHGGGRRISDVA
jgi:peptidoglycan/xylan/chitin deacetylase (PgdA/CDA1 family)